MRLLRLLPAAVLAASLLALTAEAAAPLKFKLGFVDPDDSTYAQGGHRFAEELERLTEGKIQVEIVADGELGNEREMYSGARMGTVDMVTAANTVVSQFIPELVILDQMFLFKDADQAHAAVDGKLGELIAKAAEEQGIHIIGWFESGFRDTFSRFPIEKIDDFSGLRIRTMENKIQIAAMNALEAIPTPLPYTELTPALRAGSVDACENAISNMLVNQYYEMLHHVTNSHHQFTFIMVGVSDRAWQEIPKALRPRLYEAMQVAVKWQREYLEDLNAESVRELEYHGVQFHDIDLEALRERVTPAISKYISGVPPEWIDALHEAQAVGSDGTWPQ